MSKSRSAPALTPAELVERLEDQPLAAECRFARLTPIAGDEDSALHWVRRSGHVVRVRRGDRDSAGRRSMGEGADRTRHVSGGVLAAIGDGAFEIAGGARDDSSEVRARTGGKRQRQHCSDDAACDDASRKAGALRVQAAPAHGVVACDRAVCRGVLHDCLMCVWITSHKRHVNPVRQKRLFTTRHARRQVWKGDSVRHQTAVRRLAGTEMAPS